MLFGLFINSEFKKRHFFNSHANAMHFCSILRIEELILPSE